MKPECPNGVGYSNLQWAYAAGRYQVEKSSQLTAVITIQCNVENDYTFARPQVWFRSPDPEEDFTSPPFTHSYSIEKPTPGKPFVMTLVVDTSNVPAGRDVMVFRPQVESYGWVQDVDKNAPIISHSFSCGSRSQTLFTSWAPGQPL